MSSNGAATRFWARRELGSRWRSLVVLGLLTAVTGGVAFAAIAGARRTETAYARWRVATAAPDAIVFGTQVGLFDNTDYSPVTDLPEVVDAGKFELTPVGLKGYGFGSLPPGDSHLYTTLAKPLLVSGRSPNPKRADEVLVNRTAARDYDLHVGSKVTIVSSTNTDAFFTSGKLDGPSQRATVVGIGDGPMDSIFAPDEAGFVPSYAFLEQHPEIPLVPNLVVRLRPGTDVNTFHERAVAAMQESGVDVNDIPVRDSAEDTKRVTHGTDLERTGLLLFAGAMLIAGLVLVGQAITRFVYAVAESSPALRAMGFTRGQLIAGLVLPFVLTAVVAAIGTIVLAVAVSPLFPIGLAGSLEPDPGVHFDGVVVVFGGVLVAIIAILIAAGAAIRATSPRTVRADRESALVRGIRAHAPLPVAIGAGLALEGGRGERSLPVRPAIAGAIAAVVGVIGALGLVAGIDDALTHPERAGQVWDTEIFVADDAPLATVAAGARRDPDVGRVVRVLRYPIDVGGAGLPVYALDPIRGDTTFELLSGRAPAGPDEAVLGPSTSTALQKGIGDRIRLGKDPTVTVRVVGTALLPQTPHTSFDQGVWMTPTGIAPLAPTVSDDPAAGGYETIAVAFRPGVDLEQGLTRLPKYTVSEDIQAATPPQDVIYLENVRTLPKMLAVFLALLGLAAVGHVLVTAVRRRRHDIAILRAVGFRPAQAAACISWQATIVGVIGLAIGLPVGIAAGRLAWRWVADNTPLLYVAPVAIVAVVLIIPATIVLANLLAALPARRAARVRPATVLRTE